MATLDEIRNYQYILTNTIQKIIYTKGLVKSGYMMRNTVVKIVVKDKTDISIRIESVDYFDDVNDRLRSEGHTTVIEDFKKSEEYQRCINDIENYYVDQVIDESFKDIKDVSNNN